MAEVEDKLKEFWKHLVNEHTSFCCEQELIDCVHWLMLTVVSHIIGNYHAFIGHFHEVQHVCISSKDSGEL